MARRARRSIYSLTIAGFFPESQADPVLTPGSLEVVPGRSLPTLLSFYWITYPNLSATQPNSIETEARFSHDNADSLAYTAVLKRSRRYGNEWARRLFGRQGVLLVVDDTPESLVLLTDILAAEGYEVRPADSGELAVAAAAAIRPELILLDIRMPNMNGFEVFRRLQALPETRDIPIIFLSASAETEERLEGWRIGGVDFVSKPFEKQELIARVGARLELSRLQKRLELLVAERTASLETANQQLRDELAERVRAEQALRESEARFRSMADTAPALIWTSGPDTRINFWNSYALTFIGRTLDKLIGDGWKEVLHPEDLETRYPAYVPLIEAHRPYQAEYRICRADGEYRWLLDTATPRFLSDGAFAGYIGIAMDITDLKRNLEQLMAAQKYESVGLLVAGVAHRFNNLMGTIIAEADLAASELSPESAEHANVMRIGATAIRASEIVSLLMSYAGGGSAGVPNLLNLSHVIEESLRLFKATVFKDIDLTVQPRKPAAAY